VFDKPPLFPIGEAYANIIPDDTAEVMGVLYEVDVSELAYIELTEGVPLDNYRRVQLAVRPLDDPSAQVVQALSLTSESRDETLRPSERYMGVIIEGALEHGLPEGYIAFLRSVPSQPESPAAARWRPMLDEIFKRLRCGDEKALQSAEVEALSRAIAGAPPKEK